MAEQVNTCIIFTGDISFSQMFSYSWNKDFLSAEVSEFLQTADTVVGNIESPMTTEISSTNRTLVHRSNPESGAYLRKNNICVWNMGNNHIMDCGVKGILDSLYCAKMNECSVIGAGENLYHAAEPIIVGKDVKIACISVANPWNYVKATQSQPGVLTWDNTDLLKQTIQKAKKSANWIVLIVHGGDEYCDIAMPNMRTIYRGFLGLGADIIIGHHPHVVQNYEHIGKKSIFYSLGNFIFDTENQRGFDHTETGILLRVSFGMEKYHIEVFPTRVDRDNGIVRKGTVPPVFCEFSEKEYMDIWPVEADYFYKEDYKKRLLLSKRMRKSPKWLRVLNEIFRCRKQKVRIIHLGRIMNKFGYAGKNCQDDILSYIQSEPLHTLDVGTVNNKSL